MNNDLTGVSTGLETDSSEHISPNTNYSRWMTDMASDIAHLKLYQLAIPGAHNSGVDMAGTWGVEELMAACQNKSFSHQLAAGARYLDLRLQDNSYMKQIGNFAPEYVFQEELEFTHGNDSFWYENPSAGRTPEDLVRTVKNFVENNPGEIVILDFHQFKKMRSYSVENTLRYFTPIKDLLIPPSASNLTIGEIRRQHPGRSIILSFSFGRPDKWKPEWVQANQLWSGFTRVWTEDASEEVVEKLVIDAMKFPSSGIWVLGATVYTRLGPKHLDRDHRIRREVFKEGHQNANIVMVDFIERPDTQVSVTDKCIALNKLRAVDNVPPSVPNGLSVTKISDEDFTNSFKVKWEASTDNVGVVRYEVRMNDNLLVFTNRNEYTIPYLQPHTNHWFMVRAFDFLGAPSAFSPPFKLEQDVTSPTIPGNFRFDSVGFTSCYLNWEPSSDASGIAGYEVRRNGILVEFTKNTQYQFADLVPTRNYYFDVRAKDNNGLYSSRARLTLKARPVLKNPKVIITEYLPESHYYRAFLEWDEIEEPQFPLTFTHNFRGFTAELPHIEGVAPSVGFGSYDPGEELTFKSTMRIGTGDSSEEFIYTFIFDSTRPEKITDLKITSRTPTSTSIAWTPSISKNVSNYAILLNGSAPKLVPASVSSYVFEQMPTDEEFLIEVWAVSSLAFPSIVESATATRNGLPGKPGQIQIDNITPKTAELYWEQSAGSVTGYELTINNEAPITITDNTHTFVELNEATSYTVELRAFDAAGNMSEPSVASFTTKYLIPVKPGNLQVSRITHTSADIRWAVSSGLEVRYQVLLNGFLIAQTAEPHFTITHLRNHFDYRVEVRAFNPGGVSDPAGATFKTLLAPPANLRFSHLNGLCRLAWNPAFGKLPSHEISINGSVFNTGAGRWGYGFKLADLSPGPAPHHFTFKVRAQLDGDSSEESLLEKTLVDDVPPSQPGAPVASDITDTSVKLTWEPSRDDVGVTGYRVVLNSFLLFNTEDTSYTFTQLTPGAYHYVWVRARDKDGNLSASSKPTVFKTTGQPPAPPPSKPDVSITDETATTLSLEWGALEGGSGVRILLNDEHWQDVLFLPGVTMRNLIPSVEYTISVSVFDVFGQLSEPTVITHELKDTTAPSVPGNLRETSKTSDSVTLNWGASTDDIGLCDYVIYNNHEYFDRTPLTHYNATGLMPGTHVFEVRSLDLSGNLSGPAAKTVIIREPMSAPRNFRFSYAGLILTLEWDAPEDEAEINGYRIYLTGPQGTVLPYDSIQPILKPILLPRTRYGVSIMALGDGGESAPLIAEMTTK
jgi:chitodextrinase